MEHAVDQAADEFREVDRRHQRAGLFDAGAQRGAELGLLFGLERRRVAVGGLELSGQGAHLRTHLVRTQALAVGLGQVAADLHQALGQGLAVLGFHLVEGLALVEQGAHALAGRVVGFAAHRRRGGGATAGREDGRSAGLC